MQEGLQIMYKILEEIRVIGVQVVSIPDADHDMHDIRGVSKVIVKGRQAS